MVRLEEARLADIVHGIELLWRKHNPGQVYEFSMMDQDFEKIYFTEQRMEKLFQVFAGLAVVIAGIGLFGLSAYAAEQRTREMAVRKVLGATVSNLFSLLSISFIKLVATAIAVSIPIAWIVTDKWLSGFAFHVNLTAWIFFLAAALIFFVGVITITSQLLKVALQNPSDNLRVD
jgi:putative ABC transport system permease protein